MTLLAPPPDTCAETDGATFLLLAQAAGCSEACRFWWCAADPAHPSFTLLHHHHETEPHRLPSGALDDAALATAVDWLRSFH